VRLRLSPSVSVLPAGLVVLALSAGVCHAQSTVGEITDKGGALLLRADIEALMPARVQYRWPNGQGEGDLVLTADGQLSGTESHYASRSDSPAVGTWKVAEDGKLCTPKEMKAWNRKTDLCWYMLRLGGDLFMAASPEKDVKVLKLKSFAKLP
jgi:hypothetical protein